MGFTRLQYNWISKNATLDPQQRRKRFICITLTYALAMLGVGIVFLGLIISSIIQQSDATCDACI